MRLRIAVALRRALPVILVAAHLAFPIPLCAEGFGPFPVRNFNPLDQLVLNMPGDRASVVKKGTLDIRLEVANTAVIYREENPQASATIKFETLRSGLFLRYGVHDRFEIAIEIPGYYRYQGFMDGPIKTVERLTTGLSPARSALGDMSYVYNISRGGQTVVSGREGAAGLGDTTLMSKYQVLPETSVWPALSIRTAIKLPTGNEGEFFGSGSPDFGIGLASEKSLGGRWILYANLNGVFPTGRIGGMPLQPTFTGIAAAEYLWTEALSLTIQFDYYSPPFHGIGLRTLDRGVTEVAAGFGYRMASHWLWQLYAIENVDFITGSAPDFTVSTLITYRFGLWSD
ncbi:hypothetical protein W02_30690 [Nitrospira sp. KM1]|nr:hypothetical protein W02_30690 [Nitrospira sp. KM1]